MRAIGAIGLGAIRSINEVIAHRGVLGCAFARHHDLERVVNRRQVFFGELDVNYRSDDLYYFPICHMSFLLKAISNQPSAFSLWLKADI